MIARLVWAALRDRPGRSALLLLGYGLGVAVTTTLLSIGTALLEASRDPALVGGGDLLALPAGLDLETFRTGGVSSLYFTIEQAPFLYRQVLAGPRFEGRIETVAPWMDDELLYLRHRGETLPIAASGTIPSRAAALGAAPRVVAGAWEDLPADRAWIAPADSALYAELDGWHLPTGPAAADSTWAEWHYFNVVLPGGEGWLYLTYMLAGEVPDGRWGGRLLATLVGAQRPDGTRPERVFGQRWPSDRVRFRAGEPGLRIGDSRVRIGGEGTYRVTGRVRASGGGPPLRVDLRLGSPAPRYLPPLDLSEGSSASGYVVPLLDGRAEGEICVGSACRSVDGAPAYHDHNWGVWRATTWDWGQARAGAYSILYGGITRSGSEGAGDGGPADPAGSRFLFLADSLGFAGVYPVREIAVEWRGGTVRGTAGSAEGGSAAAPGSYPSRLRVVARRGADTLRLDVQVAHVRSSGVAGGPPDPYVEAVFHQMRGALTMRGRLGGRPVRAEGEGFFETWSPPARPPR